MSETATSNPTNSASADSAGDWDTDSIVDVFSPQIWLGIRAADSAPFLTLGFIAFLDLTAAAGGFGFADAD